MDALSISSLLAAPDVTPEDLARPALITDTLVWSFAELARAAALQSQRFAARGIRPASRVAFTAAPTPEIFLAIHTLAALGATLVPLHPRLSPAEATVVLEVARADHLLDAEALALPSRGAALVRPSLDAALVLPSLNAAQLALPVPDAAPLALPSLDAASSPAAPFAIVSTSGTTGRPKGAVLSRRAILAAAAASARNLGWQPDDRWLLNMPLAHVGGLSIVTRCLLARRTVVLVARFEPAAVLDAIRRHHVTLLSVVPTMLHALLQADEHHTLRLPRAILVGGAAAPPALLDTCALRGVPALTTYGLTETCSQVTSQPPRDPSVRLAGSGPPLPGFDLRIAAPDDDAPLPPHHVGRILVRGPALFDGYLPDPHSPAPAPLPTDPALTPGAHSPALAPGATRAPDSPLSPSGFHDTGDLGELDDQGHLHVHVRRTDLIVTGGENVYPVEVEQTLERCPGVRRALVFGVPDERWGHLVAAAVEVDRDSPPSPSALFDLLSTTLATHKRPRLIAFVNQLPLTASGKLERREASSRFAETLAPFP